LDCIKFIWIFTIRIFKPIFSILYPDYGPSIDDNHSFIVNYKMGEQKSLGTHVDQSHITINVCLGKIFEGGDLYFKCLLKDINSEEKKDLIHTHKKGLAVLHRGDMIHGATPIESGERMNLIIWYRSKEHMTITYELKENEG